MRVRGRRQYLARRGNAAIMFLMARMKQLFALAGFLFFSPALVLAQAQDEGAEEQDVLTYGGTHWTDENGNPYREQNVYKLTLQNLELSAEDIAGIAEIKSLKYLEVGLGPEVITFLSPDTSAWAALTQAGDRQHLRQQFAGEPFGISFQAAAAEISGDPFSHQ